jgi:hypothetical protein
VERRRLLGTGVAAGVIGALGAGTAASEQQRDNQDAERVARVLEQLRDAVREQRAFDELAAVRSSQQTFLRANGKLPDFIEIGMEVWFGVYDWHIRWQVPPVIGRDMNGRHTIKLMDTTLILRPETVGSFVGIPYDNR